LPLEAVAPALNLLRFLRGSWASVAIATAVLLVRDVAVDAVAPPLRDFAICNLASSILKAVSFTKNVAFSALISAFSFPSITTAFVGLLVVCTCEKQSTVSRLRIYDVLTNKVLLNKPLLRYRVQPPAEQLMVLVDH
jgi:hypothetical protein